ncbi:MAG: tyrosine-type recombinase/integrase [Nitriliruptor sp.]
MAVQEGGARSGVQRYQTKSGETRWRIRWELPPDAAGKRRQGSRRGFRRQSEAKKVLNEILTDLGEGSYVPVDRLTVEEWLVGEWLPARRPEGGTTGRSRRQQLSLTSWSQYQSYIRAYVVPQIGSIALQELSGDDLHRLYDRLEVSGGKRGRGLSAKTLANLHGVLHKALGDAVRRGRLARNVADQVQAPGAERVQMRWWSVEQLREFVRHVEGDRLYAAWLLFVTTGMRRGEVAGLAWDDLDLDEGRLTVQWQLGLIDGVPIFKPRPKSRAGRRTLALDPATVEALRTHQRQQAVERAEVGALWQPVQQDQFGTARRDLVFSWEDGSLINPERFTTWFKRHCRAAGLPEIRLHDVRHSYASAGLANARGWYEVKVISERLGHANLAITLDTYAHVLPAADEATAHTLATAILGR